MDALEFLKTKSRMCNTYINMICCGDCKNLGCPVALKYDDCNISNKSDDEILGIVDIVKKWGKQHPIIKLTEQQKTAIKGRIAEGTLWVCKDKFNDEIYFSVSKPYKEYYGSAEFSFDEKYSIAANETLYNFVNFENSPIYLSDLLEGEELEKLKKSFAEDFKHEEHTE